MPEVLMPRLSDATAEATIVAWLVPDGTLVRVGDEVVEIETDKATTAWPADHEGVLSIAIPAGRTVCPGTAIARIGDGPAGGTTGAGTNGATGNGKATTDGAATNGAEATDQTATQGPAADGVTAKGVSPGDGAPGDGAAAKARPTDGADDDAAPGAPTLREPTRIERLVSERMVQSRTEIPEFTASVDIDLAAALRLRSDLKTVGAPGGGGRTPSVNDLFVKACALALVDHPRVRSAWTDEGVLQHERIDVGVAVATDDGGLVVPVVRGADRLGLASLAAETRDLTGRARKGRITPAEMAGATFSISNLGAMGVTHFTAIIGPGQGAILAIGAAVDRFVPVDGAPVLRPVCTVTLSSDHRVIYGAHAAAFLDRLRTILEHPGALAF
ncbi:dihydrolipoamide acetyltransferase family protein [Patulibacter minatonensis]|uniref:dihydrolipoamide acetyltransferase family protein n=1 Tax=Patulibacter minatonensis TaxID=298163 RepID=UPI00068565B2|nr:dihydrolipoamide acetyltransferase family protein [Patulibacter minatonensis]